MEASAASETVGTKVDLPAGTSAQALPRGLECRSCGYDVSALDAPMTEARCPECGLEVARSLHAWRRSGELTLSQLRALRLAAIMSGIAIPLLFLWAILSPGLLWRQPLGGAAQMFVYGVVAVASVLLLLGGWLRKDAREVALSTRDVIVARTGLAVLVSAFALGWLLFLLSTIMSVTVQHPLVGTAVRGLLIASFVVIMALVLRASRRASQHCAEGLHVVAIRCAGVYCVVLGMGMLVNSVGSSYVGPLWSDLVVASMLRGSLGVLLLVGVVMWAVMMFWLAAALRPLASEKWLAR
jgi:predicted RNA-binding Zn-ribbon protein involved in translation (DUF1610 family)